MNSFMELPLHLRAELVTYSLFVLALFLFLGRDIYRERVYRKKLVAKGLLIKLAQNKINCTDRAEREVGMILMESAFDDDPEFQKYLRSIRDIVHERWWDEDTKSTVSSRR